LSWRLNQEQKAELQERDLKIAEANEGVAKSKEELARLEIELARAQKEAEEERIARLKLEEKIAPRRLSVEQQARIAEKLRFYAGQRINVLIYRGDVEAWVVADQIKAALGGEHGAGWIVNSATVTEWNRAFSGMLVETTVKADAKGLAAASALVSVLAAEKIVLSGPSPALAALKGEAFGVLDPQANIQLVIGNKP
jgi:hypothetical protein